VIQLEKELFEANEEANPLVERKFVDGQIVQEIIPDSG
jgi:hypothetical protein